MSENFFTLLKDIILQIQEAQQAHVKANINQILSDHITVKVLKTKDKKNILKVSREK